MMLGILSKKKTLFSNLMGSKGKHFRKLEVISPIKMCWKLQL